MSEANLLERLRRHRKLSAAPLEEIQWVADHGHAHSLSAGEVLTPRSGPVKGLHIVLSGHLTLHIDGPAGRRKVMEWRDGDITGMTPYSRIVAPPADVVAEEPAEVFTVLREDLPEMIRECQQLTAVLVHIMIDRARTFTSSFLQDEKMVSLGKLAAGLAHELNNPASALKRSAGALEHGIRQFEAAARDLGARRLSAESLTAVEAAQQACLEWKAGAIRSPLDQEEHERVISGWLKDHGVEVSLADSLAETAITLESLDRLARSVVEADSMGAVLRSIAAVASAQRLSREIQQAATRVYELVAAVKSFTQMDRAAGPERVDVAAGLSDTIVVLRPKARAKGVSLSVQTEQGLPPAVGFGGELNQIWANLIDNALFAVGKDGHIELTAAREGKNVVVRVIDNGTGIPAEIVNRIFDPFFTTKPVGEGTGLGLDIVRRLVQRNNGEIEVESRPGRTEFRVRLQTEDTPASRIST